MYLLNSLMPTWTMFPFHPYVHVQVRERLEELIAQHQRRPGSVLAGIFDRLFLRPVRTKPAPTSKNSHLINFCIL